MVENLNRDIMDTLGLLGDNNVLLEGGISQGSADRTPPDIFIDTTQRTSFPPFTPQTLPLIAPTQGFKPCGNHSLLSSYWLSRYASTYAFLDPSDSASSNNRYLPHQVMAPSYFQVLSVCLGSDEQPPGTDFARGP